MANIGTITKNQFNENYTGYIKTIQNNLTFSMIKNESKEDNSKAPDFNIYALMDHGADISIGAAWSKIAKTDGKEFLSITLDDPSFLTPLNVTAFLNSSGSGYNINWNRRRAA